MRKWIVRWDFGYGPSYEVVEAETQREAHKIAYELCREDFESSADYEAEEYTEEEAEYLGLE